MAAGVDPIVLDGMKPGDRDGTSVELNGRASSLDSEESNGAALHVSLEERRADVDRALSWLKGEMVSEKRVALTACALACNICHDLPL